MKEELVIKVYVAAKIAEIEEVRKGDREKVRKGD